MSSLPRWFRCRLLANALVLALGALCLGSAAVGQVASLVRDLAPGAIYGGHRVEPHTLYGAGPRLFFFSDFGYQGQDPTAGQTGLWVSDGTAAGTQPLASVCSFACTNRFLGSLGQVVFFLGGDNNLPHLLWRSDGTRGGTFPLNASGPELHSVFNGQGKYALVGGFLFFVEESFGSSAERLWRTDGTIAGTQLVADITTSALTSSHIGSLTPLAGRLYFLGPRAADGVPVVWRSDGTPSGTAPLTGAPESSLLLAASGTHLFFDGVDAAQPGSRQLWTSDGVGAPLAVTHLAPPALSPAGWLEVLNGRALFIAQNGDAGQELWTSDGTAAGTGPMTNFAESTPFENALSYNPRLAATAGGHFVFSAAGSLWSSTGTPQSTLKIHDLPAAYASALTTLGNRVAFFSGLASEGLALWSTDGTPAGTRLLEQTCAENTICPEPAVTRVGDHLYFAVDTNVGFSLRQTDGTPAGTRPFEPAVGGSFLRFEIDLAALDGGLAFPAYDDDGLELWVKDSATSPGVRKLTDASGPESSHPSKLSTTGGRAFFWANSPPNDFPTLWQSDGTAASTVLVPNVSGYAASPVAAGGKVFFFLGGGDLWRADGSAGGTIPLTSLGPDQYSELDEPPVPYRSGVAFVVSSPSGSAIWTSDGTRAGTVETVPPPPLPAGMVLERVWIAADKLFFTAVDRNQFISKLWYAPGAGGAREITRVPYQLDPQVTELDGWFYFIASPQPGSVELWRTDGSTGGTAPVRANGLVVSASAIEELTKVDGELFFVTRDPYRIWRSDGTGSGTSVVASFQLVEDLVALESRLVFVADDGVHGREPWASDGTAAGTAMLRDVMPGPERSRPLALTPAPGRVFFTAEDGVHGRELWRTDGTPIGTRLVQDIWPGPAGSSPSEVASASGRLFFGANDGLTGHELWSLPFAASGACVSGPTAMCLQSGRYRVEAFWHDFAGNSGQAQAVALTTDSGYFWFFDAANVEVVLKVLDGSSLNRHTWVFFGSLSNVRYTVTVTDTVTLASRRYENPSGTLASVADVEAFGPRGAKSASLASASSPAISKTAMPRAERAKGAVKCVAGPTRLCLQQGRFAVDVAWRDFANRTGFGQTSPLSADTGSFWFFASANVELMVKVLDGRTVNGKFWVFFAALSTVEYTVTVTDTATGIQRFYTNPSGQLASVADTSAF